MGVQLVGTDDTASLVAVAGDVDHCPVGSTHKEPADTPGLLGQRMDDLRVEGGGRVDVIDP